LVSSPFVSVSVQAVFHPSFLVGSVDLENGLFYSETKPLSRLHSVNFLVQRSPGTLKTIATATNNKQQTTNNKQQR